MIREVARTYYQCKDCTATWNDTPKLEPGGFNLYKDDNGTHRSPAFALVKKIKLARQSDIEEFIK